MELIKKDKPGLSIKNNYDYPVEGVISLEKINSIAKRQETKNLIDSVDKNRENNNWSRILSIILIIFLALSSLNLYFYKNEHNSTGKASASEYPKEGLIISDTKFVFNNPYPKIKSISINGESPQPTEWYTNITIEYDDGRKDKKRYSGFLDNAYMFNIISFRRELVIVRQEGKQILTSVLAYDQKSESLEDVKFIRLDGRESMDLCCSYIILKPFQNGVQYDLAVRYFLGDYESLFGYGFSEYHEKFFLEKESRKVEKGPQS